MTFGTGYHPDPEAVAQRRIGFHHLKAGRGWGAAPLPLKTFNRSFLPPERGGPGIQNQFDTSACEGFALSSGTTLKFAIERTPIPLVSAPGAYAMPRMLTRLPNADGTMPLLVDEGTEPSLLVTGVQLWGVCSAKAWGDSPVSKATINAEPTLDQLEATQHFILNGAYFLTSSGDQFCRDLMVALAQGFPVQGAIAASGSAFQNYRGGILGALDDGVDHATLWVDYEWDGTNLSSLVIWGINSWGEDNWGESDIQGIRGGLYRASRDFVSKYARDAMVLDVSSTGVEQ